MVIQGQKLRILEPSMSNIVSIANTTDIYHIFSGLKAFLWVPVMGQPWAVVTEDSKHPTVQEP